MSVLVASFGWAMLQLSWQAVLVTGLWLLLERRAGDPVGRYTAGLCALGALTILFVVSVATFLLGSAPTLPVAGSLVAEAVAAGRPVLLDFGRAAWLAGVLWAAGTAVFALRHIGGWSLARRACIAHAVPARKQWTECAHDVARALGIRTTPHVVESADVDSPAVFGVFAPTIVLPAHGLDRLSNLQLRGVLAHELAHVRRGDTIVNVAQCLVEVALFFHPLVHLISRSVRTEREMICDVGAARFAGDAATYVAGLVALEESRFRCGRFALAARGAHGQLLQRARCVLTGVDTAIHTGNRSAWRARTICAMSLVIIAVAAAGTPAAARAGALSRIPAEFTVDAIDPAGAFSLTVRRGRAVAGTIAGNEVAPARITQQKDSVFILRTDGSRELAVRLSPRGGITWSPRRPTTH